MGRGGHAWHSLVPVPPDCRGKLDITPLYGNKSCQPLPMYARHVRPSATPPVMSAPSSSLCSSGDRGPHFTGCVALTSWPRPGWLTSGSGAWVLSTWCSSLYT